MICDGVGSMTEQVAYACLKNAKVQAFLYPIVDAPIGFRGGPVLTAPDVQNFRHHRGMAPYDHFQSDVEYSTYLEGDYCYAGPIYDHFGHFLSEMSHRIVSAHRRGLDHRFLFVTSSDRPSITDLGSTPRYLKEILHFLGVDDENATVIDRNTIIERLHVFEQGACWGGTPNLSYLDDLAGYSTARLNEICGDIRRPKKIYVSRSALPKVGAILGESYFEKILMKEGFSIFHPQEHSFAVQMDHYRKAETVVFAEGSAAHGTELLGRRMMKNVVLVPRSQQAHVFESVLRPRSETFSRLDIARYLGTVRANPSDGSPLFHKGASLVKPVAAPKIFRDAGISPMRGFSSVAYLLSAARDAVSYLKDSRLGPEPFSRRYALSTLRTLCFGWLRQGGASRSHKKMPL